MDKLPVEYRERFLENSWQLGQLRTAWREYKGSLTACHHLIYLAMQGKDWRAAFAPITSRRKIANGGYYTWGFRQALEQLRVYPLRRNQAKALKYRVGRWPAESRQEFEEFEKKLLAPFGGLVTPEKLVELETLLPKLPYFTREDPSLLRPDHYDAYTLPEETAQRLAECQERVQEQARLGRQAESA
jgi:hypothetical protein